MERERDKQITDIQRKTTIEQHSIIYTRGHINHPNDDNDDDDNDNNGIIYLSYQHII